MEFDVLIPVGRVGEGLERTLASIAASSRLPSRLVLVLDGVTLDAGAWARLEAMPWELVVETSARRRGVTASLKVGERHLASPCFARVDVGDEVHPRRFEIQADYLAKHPEVVVAGARSRLVLRSDRELRGRVTPAMDRADVRRWLPRKNPFVHGSLMVRLTPFREIGGYCLDFPTSQDYDLLLRLSRLGAMVILDQELHTHTFDYGSSTTFVRARTQLRMTLKAKVRYVLRGGARISPGFLLFFARDVALASLPEGLVRRLKGGRFPHAV